MDENWVNRERMIYFAGAIRGGREDAVLYQELIRFLGGFGQVLTEHVGALSLTEKGDDGPDDRSIHDRDMAWLDKAEAVVAEVTVPSLGVGYEIGWAAAIGKPVFALYRPRPGRYLSAMIAGSKGVITAFYSDMEEAKVLIRRFFENLSDKKAMEKGT